MNSQPRAKLSFGDIAKQIADSSPHNWPRAKILHSLFGAFWRGDFKRDGRTTLMLDNWASPDTQTPSRATREYILRLMPIGMAWVPAAIRRAGAEQATSDSYPWDDLIRLHPDEYEATWRWQIMERITVSRSDYRPWAWRAQLPTPLEWQYAGDDSSFDLQRAPGRPGARHLYLPEYHRRRLAGKAIENVQAEARFLCDWLNKNHPHIRAPYPKTIAKVLYRERRNSVG